MDIHVLGPLRISHGGTEVAPTARKPRQILALLLLNYSRVVPMATLIDELWDGRAPKSALSSVQTYVFQSRKRLAEATGQNMDTVGREILRTAGNGYEFVVASAQFDLRTFHRLERAGRAAMADGDLAAAAAHFRAALSLWHGPALADVEPGRNIRAELAGLELSRATMLDHRIELEMRLGRHRELLGELADLVLDNRFHEDLHAQFVIALYRCGYRDRALRVFHRLRADMVAEFGLEPSAKLYQYYRAVLTSDPALEMMPVLPLPRAAELPSGLVGAAS